MTHIVPRPRAGAARLLTSMLLLLLAAPSTARAQGGAPYVTSTGVQCGDEIVSFDTLNTPTEGAKSARLKELDKLYTYALAAWRVCAGPEPAAAARAAACKGSGWGECVADAYPGCGFVATWLETRKTAGWDEYGKYEERGALRALDAELPAQAMRVLAHKRCSDLAAGRLPQACVDLATAEAAALGTQLCDNPDKLDATLAKIAPDTAATQKQRDEIKASKTKCREPRGCGAADQRNAVSYDLANVTAKALPYYGEKAKDGCLFRDRSAAGVTPDLSRRIEDAWLDRITPVPVPTDPPADTLAHKVHGAVEKEFSFFHDPKRSDDCRTATFYVGPNGSLTHGDLPAKGAVPTLCVDSSTFAIDRPVEVKIAAYPEYPTGAGASTRIPSSARAVWPGQAVRLDLGGMFTEQPVSIVRVTVRGYPRGVSLRALAQLGEDGTRLQKSYETSDLRVEARNVAEAGAPLEIDRARLAAMDALAAALVKDEGFTAALKAMNDAVVASAGASAADQKAKVEEARTRVDAAVQAISTFLEQQALKTDSAGKPAVAAALNDAKKKLPAATSAATNTVALVTAAQAAVARYVPALQAAVVKLGADLKGSAADGDALSHKLARLCRIAKELIPVVDEDVLMAPSGPHTYVLDYDYEAGFQRAPRRDLDEHDRVYVRVRRVRPGESVAIAIGDKGVVQHAVSLVGVASGTAGAAQDQTATPSSDPTRSGGQRSGMADLDPEAVGVQATSTQILVLPGLEGAKRYDVTLCALSDKTHACPPKDGDTPDKVRILAHSSVVVHAKRYLGVRAGLGFSGSFGAVRSLVKVPESSTLQLVRSASFTPEISVPLLLTVYAIPRDAVDLPRGFTLGFGAGPDMVATFQAKPKLYGALVLDWYGFGLTGGLVAQGLQSVNVAEGRYVASADSTLRFYPGAFVSLTTDLDIFEAVFRKYITGNNLPSVGTGVTP